MTEQNANNCFWDALEKQLPADQIEFTLWLHDWSFYEAFKNRQASEMQGNDPATIYKCLKLVEKRLQGKAKPSSSLLSNFEDSRDFQAPGKMINFLNVNYFTGWQKI